MKGSKKMPKLDNLLQQAAIIRTTLYQHDDEERFKKTALFAKKLIDKEYTIGFAGHFSAGKSSMINALTGEDLITLKPDSDKCQYRQSKENGQRIMQSSIYRWDGGKIWREWISGSRKVI